MECYAGEPGYSCVRTGQSKPGAKGSHRRGCLIRGLIGGNDLDEIFYLALHGSLP